MLSLTAYIAAILLAFSSNWADDNFLVEVVKLKLKLHTDVNAHIETKDNKEAFNRFLLKFILLK